LLDNVIENWSLIVGSHRWEGETDDTIKSGLLEDFSVLLHDFSESLVFDLNSTNVSVIRVYFTLKLSSTELDVELEIKLFVVRRSSAVVLFMVGAAGVLALFAVNPHVGGTGIINNIEAVCGRTKTEFTGVLGVFEVV
jgi:hypothetical protein